MPDTMKEFLEKLEIKHREMAKEIQIMLKDTLGVTDCLLIWPEGGFVFLFSFEALFQQEKVNIDLRGGGGCRFPFFWKITVSLNDKSKSKIAHSWESFSYEKIIGMADDLHNWIAANLSSSLKIPPTNCPGCGSELLEVAQPENSMLNWDQWHQNRRGDLRCTGCKKFYFFINGELKDRHNN